MASIIMPGRFRDKPPLGVQIAQDHPMASGLVGAWLLNEGGGYRAFDSTCRRAQGTIATTIGWKATPSGWGLDFDADEGVAVHTTRIISDKTNVSVLALAATTDTTGANGRALYSERGSAGNAIWKFVRCDSTTDAAQNKLSFVHRDDAGTLSRFAGSTVITDGKFRQLGMTKLGTAVKLYVDGKQDGSSTVTGTDTLTDASMAAGIGRDLADITGFWTGQVVFLYLWLRTLSAEEMWALKNEPYMMFAMQRRIFVNTTAVATGGPFPHYTRRMLTGGMPVGVM